MSSSNDKQLFKSWCVCTNEPTLNWNKGKERFEHTSYCTQSTNVTTCCAYTQDVTIFDVDTIFDSNSIARGAKKNRTAGQRYKQFISFVTILSYSYIYIYSRHPTWSFRWWFNSIRIVCVSFDEARSIIVRKFIQRYDAWDIFLNAIDESRLIASILFFSLFFFSFFKNLYKY